MSIEEKAKAYDKALEKAKEYINSKGIGDTVDLCKHLFPQLQESEDEKIRNALIDFFDSALGKDLLQRKCGLNPDAVLAYLEKQKTSEEAIRYVKENHSPDEVSDFQLAMNIAVAKAYDKGVQDTLEKQKEFVSEDFEIIWKTEDCKTLLDEGEKLSPRFKEMFKEVCHSWYDKGIEVGVKQKEQKPAEWSEEECGRLFDIEHYLNGTLPLSTDRKIACIDFLKSLRPQGSKDSLQTHWKPTEKQKEVLESVICDYREIGLNATASYLQEILDHLKNM